MNGLQALDDEKMHVPQAFQEKWEVSLAKPTHVRDLLPEKASDTCLERMSEKVCNLTRGASWF